MAGTNFLNGTGVIEYIEEIIIHWKYWGAHNDLALLRLKNELPLSDSIKVIELQLKEVPHGEYLIIAGWGKTSDSSSYSNELKFHIMVRISWSDCFEATRKPIEGMFCLAHSKDNGACFVSRRIY